MAINKLQTTKGNSFGTYQQNRFFEALNGDYVKIDERSFEDLLVYTSRLSKLINFYGPDNKINGDWSHFFSDETVILSSIILSKPNEIEKRFKSYLKKVSLFKQPEKREKYIIRCCHEIYRVAIDFNYWFESLKKVESFSRQNLLIREEIESAITAKLADSLRIFKEVVESKKVSGLSFKEFGLIWEQPENTADTSHYNSTLDKLQVVFQNFYETLLYLKAKTPHFLEQSMNNDSHYPEIALFLAFLKLYGHTQDNVNGLIDKHVQFYYRNILQQDIKSHRLDSTYLQIALDPGAKPTMIPADTRFSGKDKVTGADVYYKAEESLLANQAKIDTIFSLYIDKHKSNLAKNNALKINNVFFADRSLDNVLSKSNNQTSSSEMIALFGEDQSRRGEEEKTMSHACIGFALSSPTLYLHGGDREIQITLNFEKSSFDQMMNVLNDLSIQEEKEADDSEKLESYFAKVFSGSFNLSLTTEDGWHKVSHYVVKKHPETHSLSFLFDVNSSVAPVVAYDQAIHENNFNSTLPVIKFELNHESFVYGYTFMSYLKLESAKFEVNVQRLRNVVLYNNIGQLSPDSPFLPFGPTPKKGAYFVVGNNEIFNKPLTDLRLNLEWFDLPQEERGFLEHYEAYKIDVDNTSYEASVSILDNGNWKPEKSSDKQTLKIFRTKQNGKNGEPVGDDTLISETVLDKIDLQKLAQPPAYQNIEDKLALTSLSQRGFLRLELINPIYGFAHDVYQSVLSEAIVENAKSGLLKSSKKIEMPKQPYAPQVKSISLGYKSESVISVKNYSDNVEEGNGQMFHIHPYGIEKKYPNMKSTDNYVMPHYSFDGAAYIGLEGINPPESISLLFDMIDEYSESSEEGIPEIDWDYLVDDIWKPLSTSKILRDETNQFLKTGIVVISLPADITNNSKVFGEGKFWLRISVRNNLESVSTLRTLATNVVTATLDNVDDLDEDFLRTSLGKYSINRTVNHINGVKSIIQPLPSFNGRPTESQDQFYTRIGERLRHKGRAVTAWDYERITLEEFPEINHATCLSNMNSHETNVPGSVLIVVSPTQEFSASRTEPMASSELLMQIKNKLIEYGSPFINVEVRNPTYERIKIICAVKFTEGHNHGYYIQKLNEDINKYLRGTLLSQSKKMGLGGTIHISDILSFIRTLSYVNFVTRFSMIQVARNVSGEYVLVDTAREKEKTGALKATKPWSILVPAPEHQISVLIENEEQRSRQAGIDYLQLGEDFIIED